MSPPTSSDVDLDHQSRSRSRAPRTNRTVRPAVNGRWALWLGLRVLTGLLLLVLARPAFAVEEVDRTTPRRAWTGFAAAAHDGDYDRASRYLDLRSVPRATKIVEGPDLARKLAYVLEHHVTVDPATLSDDPSDARDAYTVGTLVVEEDSVPIELTRVKNAEGSTRWVFSRATVTAIPELDRGYGPNDIEDRIPKRLRSPYVLGLAPWQWIGIVVALVLAIVVGRILVALARLFVKRVLFRTRRKSIDEVAAAARAPATLFFGIVAFRALSQILRLTLEAYAVTATVTTLVLVYAMAWLSIRVLAVVSVWIGERTEGGDELETRALRTRLLMLRRIASIGIGVIAVAAALLQFEVVRSVGTSLLASAGIAGIVVGFAAQKSIGALIAGIQVSIAQPVRLGDTIVLEGQQGIVEEIHLTYLVVRLADDRRLVAPLSKFLEQPFENWTRLGTELKGAVVIRADFAVPVDDIRSELVKICDASPFWDKRVATVRVVDTDESSLTLRAFVSAKTPDDLWELRCVVREKLTAHLVALEGGRYLPRARTQVLTPTAS